MPRPARPSRRDTGLLYMVRVRHIERDDVVSTSKGDGVVYAILPSTHLVGVTIDGRPKDVRPEQVEVDLWATGVRSGSLYRKLGFGVSMVMAKDIARRRGSAYLHGYLVGAQDTP